MHSHSASTSSPISSPVTTSDQWAAILRYDASRKNSTGVNQAMSESTTEAKTRRNSDHSSTSTPLIAPKRLSLGNDLPHMPEDYYTHADLLYPPLQSFARNSFGSSTVTPSFTQDDATLNSAASIQRPNTPPALKGGNAVLVDREVERLRHGKLKATRRHWRIYTGTTMLFITGLSAFVVTKYALAYLALSSSNWFLSDSSNGTRTSPDPLMRILALVGLCASAVSLLGAVSSGFYLRFSRRRSCGTWTVWIAAITSTTISLLLCVLNLALIAIWHKQYSSATSNFAATRDVSQRCKGFWALDILWDAAKSSPQAKIDQDNDTSCQHDARGTLQAFMIAGGVRLAILVIFCTIWLVCLARYNCTLDLGDTSIEEVEESAEMHKLLMDVDQGKLPSMPVLEDIPAMPGSYDQREYLDVPSESPPPPPRLDRFRWQKTEASTAEMDYNHHRKESSAETWSVGVVGQVWNALWGTNEATQTWQDGDEDSFAQIHEKQISKLGVRGWFRRDLSGQASDDYLRASCYDEDDYISPSPHLQTPTQEKRAMEGRHAAARLAKIHEQESAADREEKRRLLERQRIEFFASIAREENQGEDPSSSSSRRSSQSAGDDLPHMPELNHIRTTSFDGQSVQSQTMNRPPTHMYVRTMGKIIRTMSAIESEGSQERGDRVSRSGPSGSELY